MSKSYCVVSYEMGQAALVLEDAPGPVRVSMTTSGGDDPTVNRTAAALKEGRERRSERAVTDPSHRETPETRLTPAEKQALLERERARMAEPGYRESLVPPPAKLSSHRETPETPIDWRALNREPQPKVTHDEEGYPLGDFSLPRAVRPLPDWMPTPAELDVMEMNHAYAPRLLRAVRWLLEERDR